MAGIAFLAAQAADPIMGGAGGSGWVGAGLLGTVLAWLFLKHLPDKDRQITAIIEAKDAQMSTLLGVKDSQIERSISAAREESKAMRVTLLETVDRVCTEFREEQQQGRDECDRRFDQMMVARNHPTEPRK